MMNNIKGNLTDLIELNKNQYKLCVSGVWLTVVCTIPFVNLFKRIGCGVSIDFDSMLEDNGDLVLTSHTVKFIPALTTNWLTLTGFIAEVDKDYLLSRFKISVGGIVVPVVASSGLNVVGNKVEVHLTEIENLETKRFFWVKLVPRETKLAFITRKVKEGARSLKKNLTELATSRPFE